MAASREPSEADGFSDSLSSTGQHEVNVTLHEDKHANIGIYFLGTFNLHMRNLTDAEKLQDSPRFTYCYFVSICFIICSLSLMYAHDTLHCITLLMFIIMRYMCERPLLLKHPGVPYTHLSL